MVALGAALGDAASRVGTYAEDNRTALAVVGGVTAVGAVAYLARRKSRQGPKVKPGTLELGTGNVARDEVKGEVRSGMGSAIVHERGVHVAWRGLGPDRGRGSPRALPGMPRR